MFTATAPLKAPSPWALQAHTLRMRTWKLSTVNPGFLPECHQHLASNHAAVPFGDPTPHGRVPLWSGKGLGADSWPCHGLHVSSCGRNSLSTSFASNPRFSHSPLPPALHAALQSLRHAVRTGCPALGTAGRAHLRWCRRPGSRPATLQAVSGPAYTSLPPPPSSAASTLPHRPRNRPREQRPPTTLA